MCIVTRTSHVAAASACTDAPSLTHAVGLGCRRPWPSNALLLRNAGHETEVYQVRERACHGQDVHPNKFLPLHGGDQVPGHSTPDLVGPTRRLTLSESTMQRKRLIWHQTWNDNNLLFLPDTSGLRYHHTCLQQCIRTFLPACSPVPHAQLRTADLCWLCNVCPQVSCTINGSLVISHVMIFNHQVSAPQ